MREGLLDLIGQAREWGVNLFRAVPPAAAAKEPAGEPALGVYCRTGADGVLVGRLSREGEEFVFRYDPGYTGKTISAFPVRKPEYRSKRLWPFFAVRIPRLTVAMSARKSKNVRLTKPRSSRSWGWSQKSR